MTNTDKAERQHDDVEKLRLRLLENGYTPIRNRDKRTFMPLWPTLEITPKEIASWSRKHKRDAATGLRIENGLLAIDCDVDHPLMEKIRKRWFEEFDQFGDPDNPLLLRRGKGHKIALFARVDEPFGRMTSFGWVAPGGDSDQEVHRVETFGGGRARQFGAFGPHTVLDNGEVLVEYAWPENSPLDTPLSALPVLTTAEIERLLDIADETMEQAGWTRYETERLNDANDRLYDLTDDMFFDTNTDERLSLSELRERAATTSGLRCSASWLEGPVAVNRTRCLVGTTGGGALTIWESASGVHHYEASAAPPQRQLREEVKSAWDRLAAAAADKPTMFDRPSMSVGGNDDLDTAAAKLLSTYAYCATSTTPVVPIITRRCDDGMTFGNFRQMLRPYAREVLGPRGGTTVINPADLWLSDRKRHTVAGTQVRPDKPIPLFEEDGNLWVNAYTPPSYTALVDGGSPSIGIDFMEQLVPDPIERRWFLKALAHKVLNPGSPGPGIVFVAHDRFGTGRGTFARLLGRLLGEEYVREIPFHIIAGKSYQSQYSEWQDGALAVVVNESSETDHTASTYQTKRNTYEALKQHIDPTVQWRTIIAKGRKPYRVANCLMPFIATNHIDALPVPEGDRRVGVLANGDTRPPEYWDRVHGWMRDDANIAAFVRYLRTIDLSDYSPYAAPPTFESKLRMTDASRSDLDVGLDLAFEALTSEVFTVEQMVSRMADVKRTNGLEYPDRWEPTAKRLIQNRSYRVGVRDGKNWTVTIGGRRLPVYSISSAAAKRWTERADLRDEVLSGANVIKLQK